MDYDDNDFQSQNLHLAGEGSTNYPPVLRPYALPKFDFDDTLQGHLRFDSLVETEVFLGIESNEANHWIEDFSRGSSGIEFTSSAAESCSILRRNNVWSEATSSESVEMLLKSVGQEEIVPAQTIFGESDACKELRVLTKQMEPNLKHNDNILSKMGDVTDLQSTLLPVEISENISGLEYVGADQTRVEDASQTQEVNLLVDDLDPNSVRGKDSLHLSKGSLFTDGKCKDVNLMEFDNLVDEPQGEKIQEDSSASGMQVDNMMADVQNIILSSDELNNKDFQRNMKDTSEENPDGHVLSTDAQRTNEKAVEEATCHLETPHGSASEVDSVEESIANEDAAINVQEPSDGILQGDSNLHALGRSNDMQCPGVIAETNKCEDMILFKGTDTGGDQSKSNTHDLSPVVYESDSRYAVEPSNSNAGISSSLEPILKGDSDLHTVDRFSDRECPGVPAETNKCEDMVLLDTDTGDKSKLNTHELSPVGYKSDTGYAVEISNSHAGISSSLDPILEGDSDINTVDRCSDRECPGVADDTNKCEDMVLLDTDTGGDPSKLSTHELSPTAHGSNTRYAVEISSSNAGISPSVPTLKVDSELSNTKEDALESVFQPDSEILVRKSEASLSVSVDNEVIKGEIDENKEVHSHLTATFSSAGMLSEPHVTGASESPQDASGFSGESLNADSHVSPSILGDSTQICDENKVYRDANVHDCNQDLSYSKKDSTDLLNDSNTMDMEVGGSVGKGVGPSSFCEGSAKEEFCVPELKHDAAVNESVVGVSLENPHLASCATMDGVPLSSERDGSSSLGEGSTEKELVNQELKHDAAGNESGASLPLENPNLASFATMDVFPLSIGHGVTTNVVTGSELQAAPSPVVGSQWDKKEKTASKMSEHGIISGEVSSPLVETGPGPVSGPEKGASCDTAGQLLCKTVDQSLPITDSCNTESQSEPRPAVANEVSKSSTNEMEVSSAQCNSSLKSDGAEAIFFGRYDGATTKDNFEKASANVTEPIMHCDRNSTQPVPSPLVEMGSSTSKKAQEDNHTTVVSGDKNCSETIVSNINSDAFKICEGSVCSAPLPESHAEIVALESGGSSAVPSKPACGSHQDIGTIELSDTKHEKGAIKGSTNQNLPVSEDVDGGGGNCSSNPTNGNDASKDWRNGSSNISLIADLPEGDAANSSQLFPAIPAPKIVERSQTYSGLGQMDSKISQDISHGGPQVSDGGIVSERAIAHGGTKATPERKPRRTSSKAMGKGSATGKGSAKKGTVKATTPMRQAQRGDKLSSVSLGQSGLFQLVQLNETQLFGHVDGGTKPYSALTASTSSLPDLNTSAPPSVLFQQPFTDLQQVQLRAQIFVYGALIQGIAPEEAYMVSAFGGPDGGRSIWDNAWHACIERLHSQKSIPITPETPSLSRSGARAPDQVIKQSAFQGKGFSSPVGRASNKGTAPTASPMIPISSPLWNIPTPACEALQYSVIPRGAVMDYQQALAPLHPFQTPPARNLVGHNTSWMSQASFRSPWVASPQSSAAEATTRFSAFPSTEAVQLNNVKETSSPQLSTIKNVPSGPAGQTGGPTSVFAGASPLLDSKQVSASPGQHSADPKPRKRKNIPASEELGQITFQPQSQPESALTLAVTSSLSTSVAITTSSTTVSKAMPEKLVMSVSPTSSSDRLKNVDLDLEQRATLSEETLSKVKEARQKAEEAAALSAAAVSHSQEIWNQLDKQKDSRLISDAEAKLASAAVAVAAAAAVAKAAAAAANVASNAALQAKLMADEALASYNYGNLSQSMRSLSNDRVNALGVPSSVSILRGEDGTNSSSSILIAARETARRRVEAASAASKRAENMDAIVKAAELAAEAVSQAGTIVAMGDPLPLSELVKAGPEGYWKVPQVSSEMVVKSNDIREQSNLGTVGEDADTSAGLSKGRQSDKKETPTTAHEKSPISREVNKESMEDHLRLVDGITGFDKVSEIGSSGPKGNQVSEIRSKSTLVTVENDFEKAAQVSQESIIKEGSQVEVFKDGGGFGAAWFRANVLSLQDGKACVCYTDLLSDEGSEKLQEWVALKGEEDKPPKIRIARPVTALGYEGTRKRRRAAMADYTWSVGDKVDALIQDSWWEGVVTEKNKKDETILTVHFPAQGETSVVKAWHLRPSLIWKDGEWVEWSGVQNDCSSHEGDMPQEKRLKFGSPAVEGKGKDKTSKSIDVVGSGKPEEPSLLDLSAKEKVFNIGKNTRTENKPDAARTIRTGLQKEGSKVVFGIPKPGKKRKFMEVSKHYVANQSVKTNEANDSVKFAKYLMPQGSGPRGLKNTSKVDAKEKRLAETKLKGLKPGKERSMPGKTASQDNHLTDAVSAPDGRSEMEHTGKIQDSVSHVEGISGKHNLLETESIYRTEGTSQGPIVFSSLAASSKKVSTSSAKSERANKGKLAPAGGRLGKIEEKANSGNPARSTSEVVEPRRSNRRIQPTSRLLEGLQSSLTVSKIPSFSHDKGHRSQNKNASRGSNHG